MAKTWTIQRSQRKAGWYYQAVGPNRRTVTLGYLSDEEATWARENAAYWTEANPRLFDLDNKQVKLALVSNPSEGADAIAAFEQASTNRKVDEGDYSSMTLREYVEAVWQPIRATEVAANTSRTENRWAWPKILAVLGDTPIERLDAVRWSRFLATLDGLSGQGKVKVQNTYRCALKHMVEVGARKEAHAFRPIKGSGKPATEAAEALSVGEVARLLDNASTPMHRCLYGVAFGNGLRPGEVTRIRWEDVDLHARTLHVRGTKNRHADHVVPMTDATHDELSRWWRNEGEPTAGPCFLWRGKQIGVWEYGFFDALKRAGLYLDANGNRRKITPYSARYTFATLGVVHGVPDGVMRSAMRHTYKSAVLERTYQRLKDDQVAEGLASFPSFGGAA
ncbi:MAG: site-specific integrase [Alphaproteobacteria bacterium]|nr:site-specific integrase [Alphaproteobacteria bacterium]